MTEAAPSAPSDWYRNLAAARSPSRRHDPAWVDRLLDCLAEAGWPNCFDSTGELRDFHGRPIGRYRLCTVDEAQAGWGAARWFSLDPPCRFVGPVSGFLNWEWWADAETAADFAHDVLWATRGYLARTDRPDRVEGFVEETFPLRDAASNHGFHDGDFFLRDDPVYGEYVRGEIVAAVEALGLRTELFNGGTSHNPHRINQFVPRKNQTFATCWQTFKEHEDDPISLWGYNFAGVASAALADFVSG